MVTVIHGELLIRASCTPLIVIYELCCWC